MRWLTVLLSSIALPLLLAQGVTPVPEIHRLFLADQCDRSDAPGCTSSAAAEQTQKNDAARRERTHILIAAGALSTAQDFHDAAYIFQHGTRPEDYLLAHILAIEAVARGDASSRWIAAATLDRYLQSVGQQQVFGTQYSSKAFFYAMKHRDNYDPKNPEAKDTKTTQEPYNEKLVPDPVRATFCVPPLEKQQQAVEEAQHGSLTIPRLANCPR